MTFYNRDDSLPYWQNYVDAGTIFDAFAHRPDKAQAWLRHRNVSESCQGFQRAVLMRGHFEGGVLANHTYRWTFTPGRCGGLAIALPVFNGGRLVDCVAMSRHDHTIWGACIGTGQYIGMLAVPRLRIYRTLASWLANDCNGIVPLSKGFFPQLRNARTLVSEDDDHAWDLAERTFINPAIEFGRDAWEAEQRAYEQIEVAA